jgi:mRNA-degrading endonuclease toxin of MazEF toxin-antitoxin module
LLGHSRHNVHEGVANELRLPDGLAVKGTLLSSQLRAIDWRARPFRVVGSVSAGLLEDVNARIGAVLEMDMRA